MSTRLSSLYRWRKPHIRRPYSSSTVETSQQARQQARRAPIASDLGGIQIGPASSRFSRQGRRSDSLNIKDFKHGTLSEQLAIRELQQKRQDRVSQTVTKQHSVPSQSHSSQVDGFKLSPQKDGAYTRPRQQRRNVDMHQNHRSPAQQGARKQRRPRPVQHKFEKGGELWLDEREGTDAIDDDVDATRTILRLRRPDPPLAPRRPPLPPSLTTLEQKIYVETPTHKLLEQQGGEYGRYFSLEEWKIARAQLSAPLSVVDYARLALHLNKTVSITQRREGVEIVKKHVQKVNVITAPL